MLAGERPFRGQHLAEVVFSVVNSKVRPLREQRPEIPLELERILDRALEKNRELRYASAAGLMAELGAFRETLSAGRAQPPSSPPRKRAARAVALVVVLAAAAVPLYWRQSRIRWARQTALPEVERLIAKGSYLAAFDLAREVERRLGDDPQLAKLWPEMSVALTVETSPPDAEVSLKPYAEPGAPWRNLGRSPLKQVRVPQGSFRFRATKQGHEPAETMALLQQAGTLRLALDPVGAQPGMVHVPAGAFRTILAHFGVLGPIELGEYWLDRYEVTNRQFKQFLDAGGYQKPEYWKHPAGAFRDATGRPGPAFWEAGAYPDGQDHYPVTGVSWYEAATYAAWAGKSLPTLYHWYHAAGVISSSDVAPFSNFGGTGPAKSGQFTGLSPSGAYDMAGNVKEWVWNEVDGKRFILGGAWDEPSYIFTWAEFRSPADRSRNNGFRCVKYGAPPPEQLLGPLRTRSRDCATEKPVSEDVFRIFRSMYAREPAPLQTRVEATDNAPEYWTREKVTYAAGYGKQRLAAHLFLPKLGAPPYQAVVFMPGSNALFFRSSDRELWAMPWLDFLVKSGRALVCPVWYGTYERQIGLQVQQHNREVLSNWVRDLGATIDYLESRPDFDGARVAFLGFSMGARGAVMLTALEPRAKANILMDGGLPYVPRSPEIDEINFAPRVKAPTLMLNGKYDFIFPADQTQAPLFRLLGTPEKDKRRVVFETGHNVLALRPQAAKEMLDWLDRYLGSVTRR
jgi:formylglycine-generating enzyme required for sulfatase activity/dienelactone hydrolase